MENNSLITGKIPVTGNGFHKTYEDSVIRRIAYSGPSVNIFNSYNNEHFIKSDGSIWWASDENEYNNYLNDNDYKRVVIINVMLLSTDPNSGLPTYLVEVIEPNLLRLHLYNEEKQRIEALESEKTLKL